MIIPEGQMSQIERDYIYKTIKNSNVKVALESGTWYGGGSTLSITKGLTETNGILYTYEECNQFYNVAKNFYHNSEYINNIRLFNSSFIDGLSELSEEFYKSIDFILLDGGDELPNGSHKHDTIKYLENFNISENVQSFKILENKIKIGCDILLHDWTINVGRGNFVKRYLETSNNINNFQLINVIDTTTGLAHLKKIK